MKKTRVIIAVLILLVAIVSAFTIIDCYRNRPANDADVVKNIMQDIDNRVVWVQARIEYKWYEDHYDDDTVIYRSLEQGAEDDSLTSYYLYYDERGKLIYAEIAHYRSALYSIYFHDDQLLHVEVGPFSYAGGLFIHGDISNVQVVITEDPSYAFVLEDLYYGAIKL